MREIWKPVLNWEALYEVSDHGHVRSLPRHTVKGVRGGRELKPYLRRDGYLEVYLHAPGRARASRLVHHLVLEAFDRPRPDGLETLHGPGGKTDNRLANISWGTRSQNMGEDRLRDGQSNRGERSGQAKLSWEDVCEIRRLIAERQLFQYQVAERFGVCRQIVTLIKQGKIWTHPPEQW